MCMSFLTSILISILMLICSFWGIMRRGEMTTAWALGSQHLRNHRSEKTLT